MDIAHPLSMMCRGNGHYEHFYSVAQHSVNCAKEAELRGQSHRIQLACLLHDASEAYISDITRPVKRLLVEYLTIEEKLQNFIFDFYGIGDLSEEEEAIVKDIDDSMLNYELKELLEKDRVYDFNVTSRSLPSSISGR
ncbi:HD domain-containing protein [Oceanirhabdus sp. W0125-5]|uniref:HD domain-containing protein n=1 Tax=Oceanirhabdus sp. W0125-5 TaxID=2999116 RepID=UPI0022F33F03|nr:HD domain-containing protein [Oceanirhabdus sp. W0125-5]WBW97304.1 HD domain-containing protein [Oceanirhabdus sp. W0125-5]